MFFLLVGGTQMDLVDGILYFCKYAHSKTVFLNSRNPQDCIYFALTQN